MISSEEQQWSDCVVGDFKNHRTQLKLIRWALLLQSFINIGLITLVARLVHK